MLKIDIDNRMLANIAASICIYTNTNIIVEEV